MNMFNWLKFLVTRIPQRAARRGSASGLRTWTGCVGQQVASVAGPVSADVELLEDRVVPTLNFTAAANFDVGALPYTVAVDDFNGDGHADLATANAFSNNVSVLLGNGLGGFAAAVNFAVGGDEPRSVTVADFNGDGKADLAAANFYSNNVSVLLGNGLGDFAPAVNFGVGIWPHSVTVGDFNGDGKADLSTANLSSNNVSVLLGNGLGSFAAAANFSVGTNPHSVTVADFNGDGQADLVTANYHSNNVSVLLNTSTSTTNQPPAIPVDNNAADNSVMEGSAIGTTLGVTAFASDPNGDTVTYSLTDNAGGRFDINLSSGVITVADGSLLNGLASHTITVQADDGHGGISSSDFSISVDNVAPTAADDAIMVQENDPAQVVNVLANDSDPAGTNDPLSVTSVNTAGTAGTVTLNAGQVSYSPDGFFETLGAGEVDLDSFEYSISDGDGGTNTGTVTVTVNGQNDAPTVTGMLSDVTVNQNAANSVIDLMGLFRDVDAPDTLTITAVSSSSGLVTAGVSGSSLTLDYKTNQSGTATITVTAADGSGASVSLTFDVAVLSPAQQAIPIIQLIQQWQTDGKITAGVVNSMIAKLQNSLTSYNNGNLTAAGNQLSAMKNQISALFNSGKLTLLDYTLAINWIDALNDSMTP